MIIRVPLLLQKSIAVIYRLDIAATRTADPSGEDTYGYDETLRETVVYDDPIDGRTDVRQENAEIKVPCQVETWSFEDLREAGVGDAPVTNMVFVFHRKDLETFGLLDTDRNVTLKKGDRIDHLERFGAVANITTKKFSDPGLYIYEIRPGSWGFGPDGYDLEIAFTTKRQEGVI